MLGWFSPQRSPKHLWLFAGLMALIFMVGVLLNVLH